MGSQLAMASIATAPIMTLSLVIIVFSVGCSSLPKIVTKNKIKCKQEHKVIAPKVAQNIKGQLKFVQQENSTHSDNVQTLQVTLCQDPGSSCLSCDDTDHDDKLCQQSYTSVHLWVL